MSSPWLLTKLFGVIALIVAVLVWEGRGVANSQDEDKQSSFDERAVYAKEVKEEDARKKEQSIVDDAANYAAIYAEEVEERQCDLDGDGVEELIRVTWQAGGSDKPIRVDVFRDKKLVQTLGPVMGGIQSNYALKDTNGDGRPELFIWSGLWDFRLPGENGLGEQEYEGHSASHRYVVATYKWMRDAFWVWEIYTTKKKYDPYPENVPE